MHDEVLFDLSRAIPKIDRENEEVAVDIGSGTLSAKGTERYVHIVDFLVVFIEHPQLYAWRRGNWTPILTQLEMTVE